MFTELQTIALGGELKTSGSQQSLTRLLLATEVQNWAVPGSDDAEKAKLVALTQTHRERAREQKVVHRPWALVLCMLAPFHVLLAHFNGAEPPLTLSVTPLLFRCMTGQNVVRNVFLKATVLKIKQLQINKGAEAGRPCSRFIYSVAIPSAECLRQHKYVKLVSLEYLF